MRNTFSRHRPQEIIVLHDNAPFHNIVDDDEIFVACNEAPTVGIVFQLANNPDFNVSDLRFFHPFSPFRI